MWRYFFPVLLGVVGCAILLGLGVWQVQRLAWKENMLARIQAEIDAPPQPLPHAPDISMKYRPVQLRGTTTGEEILVLSGSPFQGAGYQVISVLRTDDGRRVMVDRGFLVQDLRAAPRPPVTLDIVGNLHWPDETSAATPDPDITHNIWFARDVDSMAQHLGTLPVLVVAARVDGDTQQITPVPIAITGIPNNHFGYAVTWFLLAIAWAGMTTGLVWRIRQRQY